MAVDGEVYKKGNKKGEPKTKQDKIVQYLVETLGVNELPSKSKYRKFTHIQPGKFYFVGKNGALRFGKNVSTSVSLHYTSSERGG
ncbi:MAG: hypothetical protein ACOC56_02710 [Atribacterota bacterium]